MTVASATHVERTLVLISLLLRNLSDLVFRGPTANTQSASEKDDSYYNGMLCFHNRCGLLTESQAYV